MTDSCQTIEVRRFLVGWIDTGHGNREEDEEERDVPCIHPAAATDVDNNLRVCISCAYQRLLEGFEIELDRGAERKVRTNTARTALKKLRRRLRKVTTTPLMRLGNVVGLVHRVNTDTVYLKIGVIIADDYRQLCVEDVWSKVPADLLEEAYGHIEQRLIRAEYTSGSRARSTVKWLGRWQGRINAEFARRQVVVDTRHDSAQPSIG